MPERFDKWRPNQEEFISLMLDKSKRGTELCAPTGFGKTLAYTAGAVLSGEPTCVVTQNRGLQDQLMDEFGCIGMVDIRGKRNYTCDMREDFTCEDGAAARCPYIGTVACPSSQAEMRAATSSLVTTNYDKWIASRKYGTGMSHFTQVIFDEGHHAPEALARAMQVILHHREIEQDLGMDFLSHPEAEDMRNWKPWAVEARAKAEEETKAAKERIVGQTNPRPTWVKHYNHMRQLTKRLATVSTARAMDWIVDETPEGYQFDPIRPAKYAEAALLLHIPRIIVVSATIRPKTMWMIGLGNDTFTFKEFDSDFNPKQCPIYWIPTMRVDRHAEDLRMLWVRHDQIAGMRTDRKGIVHTISYARRDDISNSSRFSDRMLVNAQGEPPTQMIEDFRNSGPGAILVSPTVGTGYDFPGNQCEWQFITKVPFPPSSKILAARQHDDNEYTGYMVMQSLVQMFGRGPRSKEDWCENFICDDHFDWFRKRFGHLAPKSFHGFYQERRTLPQPPPRMA